MVSALAGAACYWRDNVQGVRARAAVLYTAVQAEMGKTSNSVVIILAVPLIAELSLDN